MAHGIYESKDRLVASFEDYNEAVSCMGLMAMALRKPLRMVARADRHVPLPDGVSLENGNGTKVIVVARP